MPRDARVEGARSIRAKPQGDTRDQPAEQVAAAQAVEVDHVGGWLVVPERRPLRECPVRPMLVVMPDVCGERVLEV